MIRPLIAALSTFAFAGAVLAAAQPALALEVQETVMTAAPPAKVWATMGQFDGIVNWLPGVVSSPADKGSAVGSVRTITLKAPGDPKVVERLTAIAPDSLSYVILQVDPKVLPVTNYASTMSVAPSGSGSLVTWRGTFQPAGGADDATASKAIHGLYRSGLDNVKAMMGQ